MRSRQTGVIRALFQPINRDLGVQKETGCLDFPTFLWRWQTLEFLSFYIQKKRKLRNLFLYAITQESVWYGKSSDGWSYRDHSIFFAISYIFLLCRTLRCHCQKNVTDCWRKRLMPDDLTLNAQYNIQSCFDLLTHSKMRFVCWQGAVLRRGGRRYINEWSVQMTKVLLYTQVVLVSLI